MRDSLDIATLIIGVAGGLALFLYGLDKLTANLKRLAGGRLKRALAGMTRDRFRAALTGTTLTAVIQSSSVTTVLVVGFLSAGLMTLPSAIGVIIGANVGTTITAQIVAFKVTEYSLVLVALGFGMASLMKTATGRHWGGAILGLGLILFGMELMSGATRPLRDFQPFIDGMQRMDNPFLAILAGAGFTAVVQSSSATTGVVIVLAGQGFISLEAGILLVLGANIGTCVTALIAAVGKTRDAVRAAWVHVLFNLIGVLAWLAFVDDLARMVEYFSPSSPELAGAARRAAETPRQIANAHTLFNVANTLVFIWFTGPLAWLVVRLVPDRNAQGELGVQPRYLDDILLDTPILALDRARMELRRLGERALDMVQRALPEVLSGSDEDLVALAHRDDEVDALHAAIVTYLGRLSLQGLDQPQARILASYMAAANQIENIGDMVETSLVRAGRERIRKNLNPSAGTRAYLEGLHEGVVEGLQLALESLDSGDPEIAQRVLDLKGPLGSRIKDAEKRIASRLGGGEGDQIARFSLEMEVVEYLRRVYYFSKRIAKSVLKNEKHAARSAA